MSDIIAKSMNMKPLEGQIQKFEELEEQVERLDEEDLTDDEDLEFIRMSLKETIKETSDIIEEYASIAGQGQTAREYEVLGNLIRAKLEATTDLLILIEKKKKMKESTVRRAETINNNLILTTADLQRMMLNGTNNDSDED